MKYRNPVRSGEATLRKGIFLLVVALLSICLMASDCGEDAQIEFGYSYRPNISVPQWTPDGTRIVVELGRGIIFAIDTDGSNLKTLNGDADNRNRDAHAPSISSDGSQVVFSQRLKTGPLLNSFLSYELVLSDLEGPNNQRLTEDRANYVAPVWSPDGTRIAFLSDRLSLEDLSDDHYLTDFTLFTMAPDGTDMRSLAPDVFAWENGAYPAWSPDGSKIAFLSTEQLPDKSFQYVIYVVGSDGSDLRRLTETGSLPAWSPDSRRITFLKWAEGDKAVIYSIDLDGSGLTEIAKVLKERLVHRRFYTPYILEWTADGSEIRFGSYPFIVAKADGSDINVQRHLYPDFADVAWSPDGSKVAVNPRFGQQEYDRSGSVSENDQAVILFTMMPDGSDKRVLIEYGGGGKYKEGKGQLWNSDYAR